MNPEQYCQQKAAASGSSFYYSFLFLPARQRAAIMALYAFCREVDDVVDNCSDLSVAKVKLNWWRQELDRLYAGNPQHPITVAMASALEHYNLSRSLLGEIIDGMEMDLTQNRYDRFDDLLQYCYRAAGVVGLLAAEIFGYQNPKTLEYAENLGIAFQLTNIIRDVREDLDRERIYLPLEDLQAYQVTYEELNRRKTTANIRRLMQFQADRARDYYRRAFESLPSEDRYSQRSGIIMAEIYLKTLDEIEQDGFQVLEQRIRLTPLRKFWIAWKVARREKKQFAKPASVA